MRDDGFMRGHSVSRVLAVAVPVAIFLVWWGVWGPGGGQKISVTEVSGEVIQNEGRVCLVRAQGGETARLLCPKRYTARAKLRLQRVVYDSGEVRFELLQGAAQAADPTPEQQ